MAHGAEDYSNVRKKEYSYRIDDLAELAARVGSPVVYDRRGEVVFMETFAYGFDPWATGYDGTYAAVLLDPLRFVSNGFSVLLRAGTDLDGFATLQRYFPSLSVEKLGLEFRAYINPNVKSLSAEIEVYDGTYLHDAAIYYYPVSGIVRIKGPKGYTEIAMEDKFLALDVQMFSFVKIVFDLIDKNYLRIIFNGEQKGISSVKYYNPSSDKKPHVKILFYCISNGEGNAETYLDNIILTRNET